MRFNRKKEKEFKFSDYKGENKPGLLTSFDRLEYIYVETKDDEELFKICDTLLGGRPVIVNFDKLNGADCNYMLAFISGVVYALEGQ
ncbi:MAG: cell division protein SepF, partial [Bacilli bacterium]|nr:cell division protein SepF [Bacilli bacterium]